MKHYCVTQPLENYNMVTSLGVLGLQKSYGDRPALLGAILLMTEIPFQWEEGSPVPPLERFSKLTEETEGLLSDTLYENIGGKLLTALISSLNPWEFLQYLEGFTIYTMPICRKIPPPQLIDRIKARVSAWARGRFVESQIPPATLMELRRMEEKYKGVVYEGWV